MNKKTIFLNDLKIKSFFRNIDICGFMDKNDFFKKQALPRNVGIYRDMDKICFFKIFCRYIIKTDLFLEMLIFAEICAKTDLFLEMLIFSDI